MPFTAVNLHLKCKFVALSSKAADARHFASFVHDTVVELRDRFVALPEFDLVYSCALGLKSYYDVMYSSGPFMTDLETEKLIKAARTMMTSFVALHVLEADKRLWKPKPKDHQLIHLAEDWATKTHINPRLTANYKNDNFVRLMKRMTKACDRRNMTTTVAEHFLLNAGLVWAAIAAGQELDLPDT